ncbi:MAG: NfeD family protein [Lachnospiraceae bacterium]|nr:NfeD family protein [Lachnospiraceae bacterium]
MNSIFWLGAMAVMLVIEAVTLGLTTIWFAGGALAAFLISLAVDNILIEFIVFFAVSLLLLFYTRPLAAKYFNKGRVRTNYESYIGQEAKVTEKIDNFNATGAVLLDGKEWTARAEDDRCVIEPGKRVVVKRIEGVKAIVAEESEVL